MKKLKLYFPILLSVVTLISVGCEEDHEPKGQFESGVFVTNEGNFMDADGSVSHINLSNNEVTQDLFGTNNSGRALGDVVQSMTIDGDQAYVVVNNSNKIEVVNANTFEADYTITDLLLPRYLTTYKGKGYVTEWVGFSSAGRVSIIDLQSHAIIGSIKTYRGAENIIAHNGKLFVSNTFTDTVSVIDPSSEEVIASIKVGKAPGGLVVDNQNKLWVLCGGGYDESYAPLNNGKLIQIDPSDYSVLQTIELNQNISTKIAISKDKDAIFYFKGKSVYKVNIAGAEAPSAPLLTEASAVSFYGIGIDPKTNILYVADAKSFASSGTVYRYAADGTAIDNLIVGRGPNGFVFK